MQKEFSIKEAFSQGCELINQHKKHLLTLLWNTVLLIFFSSIIYLIVTALFYKIHGPLTLITYIKKTRTVTETTDYSLAINFSWCNQLFSLITDIFKQSVQPHGKIFIRVFQLLHSMALSLFFIIATRMVFDLFKTGTTSEKSMLDIKKYIVPTFLAEFILTLGYKFVERILFYFNPSLIIDFTSPVDMHPFTYTVLLLLLISAVISIPFGLYDLIVVDDECSGIESLKISYTLTKGHWFKLFLFNITSFIAFILTLGLAYPIVLAARVYVYNQLKGND